MQSSDTRIANDGQAYTFEEFVAHYGDLAESQWQKATPAISGAPHEGTAAQPASDLLSRSRPFSRAAQPASDASSTAAQPASDASSMLPDVVQHVATLEMQLELLQEHVKNSAAQPEEETNISAMTARAASQAEASRVVKLEPFESQRRGFAHGHVAKHSAS